MTLRLNGATSGYTEIDAAAVAGSNLVTLPTGTGTVPLMTLATAQNSTSGTAIDFTGIPSWVKRITVMFNGVSTNGTSLPQVQLGSGSVTTSGYTSYGTVVGIAAASGSATSGIVIYDNSPVATNVLTGNMFIVNQSGNTWTVSYIIADPPRTGNKLGAGGVSLSGALDRVRITTVNGTDTFDAGSINILYEG